MKNGIKKNGANGASPKSGGQAKKNRNDEKKGPIDTNGATESRAQTKNKRSKNKKVKNKDTTPQSAGVTPGETKSETASCTKGENAKNGANGENGVKASQILEKEASASEPAVKTIANGESEAHANGSRPSMTSMMAMQDSTSVLFGSYDTAGDKKWG